MVEVGVAGGRLSAYLLEQRKDLRLHAVDSWLGTDQQSESYKSTTDLHAKLSAADMAELKSIALKRLRPFGDRVFIHHMPSLEAAQQFDPKMLDLVFLDADHSTMAVRMDFWAWHPKVKIGGWIGGHDFDWPSVQAAFDTMPMTDVGNTWWRRRKD